MAWNFADQIHALTGFDADSTSDTETEQPFTLLSNQWLQDAVREVINVLPQKLKHKCATISIVNATNGTTMDLKSNTVGEILEITRLSADSGGYYTPCREVHPMHGDLTNDATSIHYATATDPVYWVTSNTSDASTLFIKPTATDAQPANVYHVSYPIVEFDDISILNFPDEAEYLVVLRAALTAAQYLLATEEDVELYSPIIVSLKNSYQEGVYAVQSGAFALPKKDVRIAQEKG